MAKQDIATKQDIEELAAITERAIRAEVASLRGDMATKQDLDNLRSAMATKDDLKRFATKDDLKRFATKDDLKRFATKDDLKQYATKDDLHDFKTDIFEYIDGAVERFEKLVTNMVMPVRRGVTNHEKRITKLEERVPI